MSNAYDSTLRAAEQITLNELTQASAISVRRAVKDHENRPQSPQTMTSPILVGFFPE